MKTGIISYWSCPFLRLGVLHAGGMNVYLQYLVKYLGQKKHQVYIFTRIHKAIEEKVVKLTDNVSIIHLPQKDSDLYKDTIQFSQKINQFLDSKSINLDILHSHYYYSALAAIEMQKKFNTVHLTTFHTTAASKEKYARIKDTSRKKSEEKIVKKVDGVIASTELEKKELIENYNAKEEKIYIVNPGVDLNLFKKYDKNTSRKRLKLKKDKKIILFIGRIDEVKGINFLVEAVFKMVQSYPFFKDKYQVLLIGGDVKSSVFWRKKEVQKIKKLIEEKKLSCCIKFMGSISHQILPYYYSASDVVVAPSKYESFGLVVLEAMASGTCVLASLVGGLKYLITDKVNGRLFKSGNICELCDILWELLNDGKQRIKLGENARQMSKKYDWSKQIDKIISIYQKV